MFFEACDICSSVLIVWSDLKILESRILVQHLTNCKMLIPYDGSLGTWPLRGKSEVIVVVNPVWTFCQYLKYLNPGKKFLCLKYLLYSTDVLLNIYLTFRVIDSEYIVKISRCIFKLVFEVMPYRFVKVRHKLPHNNIKINPPWIPTICWYIMPSNCAHFFLLEK